MNDISIFNVRVNIIASITFPVGFEITQFADDADSIDIPPLQIGDKGMGVNGDLVTWSVAKPFDVNLNVIPGSDDDINLGILAQANRVGKNKLGSRDIITLNVYYPNNTFASFNNGRLMNASFANSGTSAGREKSKLYGFTFQGITGNY